MSGRKPMFSGDIVTPQMNRYLPKLDRGEFLGHTAAVAFLVVAFWLSVSLWALLAH